MRLIKLIVLLVLMGTLAPTVVMTQDNSTVLMVAVPEWWEGQFDETIFDDFETQYSNVEVVVNFVSNDDMFFIPPHVDLEQHIEATLGYATKGDVLYTGSYQMAVESTRSGAFLDLTPLIATDTNLDVNDFYPALWQSFQWDGGLWAIPNGGSLIMNVYNQTAFDEANVSYPNANWTLADYANSIRDLTTYKDSGNVDTPGLNSYFLQPFFYSLLNRGVYDMSAFPETANLNDPELIEILTTWTQLIEEEVANPQGSVDFDLDDVPLHIEETWRVTNQFMANDADWQASLLPNGRAGLRADGFAISSGTNNPELAYELIMYLSQSPEMMNFFFFDTPARQSMVGEENENTARVFGEKPPELQALLDEALVNAIPISEMRYFGYVDAAIQSMRSEGKTAGEALIEAQQSLNENLTLASELGAETTVFIESPETPPELVDGEIALKFNLSTFITPLPNQEEWELVAQEFADADLEVGFIDIRAGFDGLQQMATDNDCFYRQFNDLRTAPLSELLAIEPFLNADPNFNRDDLIAGALQQATRENQIWGMPINATPTILWINENLFNDAGVPIPNANWTITEFVDALNQLANVMEDPPFEPRGFGGNYALNLVVAFGGLPIDPSMPGTPPDLQSEQMVEAIRQVLDLAKAGLIEYDALGNFSSGGGGFSPDGLAIYDSSLSAIDFRIQQRNNGVDDSFIPVLFPSGSQYNPVVFEVGVLYISANTPYAEACYRWLSHLAEHPELFDGMPVRRSQLETTRSQGEDVYALFTTIDTVLNDPNTIIFPFFPSDVSDFYYQQWMYRAFDAYVLEDTDLDIALAESQLLINEYATCIAPIEEVEFDASATQEEMGAYFEQFADCAASVDPVFAEMFGNNN